MKDELFERMTASANLEAAWRRVRRNGGGPGGDGQTLDGFAHDHEARLRQLGARLLGGRYRPGPLRRHPIPKPDGSTRELAVPTVVDRVAQTAALLVLDPLLDPSFSAASFAYRRGLAVELAVGRVLACRLWGHQWVVDADIRRFFDEVPHTPLIADLARRVPSPGILRLAELWLAGFASGGRGLAQGAPLSPLLANLYLDPIDRALEGRRVRLVRYADDLVLLCRSEAAAIGARHRLAGLLAARGLTLHPEKTRITSFAAGFDFLGYRFRGGGVSRAPGGSPVTSRCASPPRRKTPSPSMPAASCSTAVPSGRG